MKISVAAVKKATAVETQKLIEVALRSARKSLHHLEPQKANSSVRSMYDQALARVETLEAVRDSLQGNHVALRILGD